MLAGHQSPVFADSVRQRHYVYSGIVQQVLLEADIVPAWRRCRLLHLARPELNVQVSRLLVQDIPLRAVAQLLGPTLILDRDVGTF